MLSRTIADSFKEHSACCSPPQMTSRAANVLFLAGWKELYLDVLQLLSPCLRSRSIVLADDVALFPDPLATYVDYKRDPAHGLASVMLPLGDGIEYSL